MPTARCPYCGHLEELTDSEFAAQIRFNCPKCRHEFPLRRADEGQVRSAASAKNPQPPNPRDTGTVVAGKVTIRCPECGFSSQVPREKIPPKKLNLTCRECQHKFIFDGGQIPPEALALHPPFIPAGDEPPQGKPRATELIKIADLFADSWLMFKRRVLTMLGTYLLGMLLVGVCAFIASSGARMLTRLLGEGPVVVLLLALVASILFTLAVAWLNAALIATVVEEDSGVREALNLGLQKTVPFFWVFSLLSFIIGGGFMAFVVPGIIFIILFSFSQFIVIAESDRGMEALLKSREYVRGKGWEVFCRIFVLGVGVVLISLVLSLIPLLGPLLAMLLWPFCIIYQYQLYTNLREFKGNVSFSCSSGNKAKWLLAGGAGYVVLPLLGLLLLGPAMLQNLAMLGNMAASGQFQLHPQGPQNPGWTEPGQQGQAMVYIFSHNYTGRVIINDQEVDKIPGLQGMSYNYTGSIPLQPGRNLLELELAGLQGQSVPQFEIKLYQVNDQTGREKVLAEKKVAGENGTFRFAIDYAEGERI